MSMVEDGRVATRDKILLLLRRHGRLSAPQLAELLGVTSVGVRRHLTLLDRDGLVTAGIEWNDKGEFFGVVRVFDVTTGAEIASRTGVGPV